MFRQHPAHRSSYQPKASPWRPARFTPSSPGSVPSWGGSPEARTRRRESTTSRHTFICRRVALWQAHGTDLDHAMLALSTYVGHAKVTDTYWYLTAVPDLMAGAGRRFEGFARPVEEARHG